MSKVEEVFSEMEMLDIDIAELMIILKNKAVDGYVDYKEFIDETFWLILSHFFFFNNELPLLAFDIFWSSSMIWFFCLFLLRMW